MRCLLGILLVALFPLLAGAEALFLRPLDNRALVRRDLLPLETDTIRTLSQNLATLAAIPLSTEDAAHNRAVAQLLALALQLDPVNQPARRLLKQHLEGGTPPQFLEEQMAKSRQGVEKVASWLLSPTSGKTGRELSRLIIDPLRILHPDLPICQEAGPEGEAERWQGVVPPITAFMNRSRRPIEETEDSATGTTDPFGAGTTNDSNETLPFPSPSNPASTRILSRPSTPACAPPYSPDGPTCPDRTKGPCD